MDEDTPQGSGLSPQEYAECLEWAYSLDPSEWVAWATWLLSFGDLPDYYEEALRAERDRLMAGLAVH